MMIERIVRVSKKDSAFFYAVFESLEGMAAYSTVAAEGSDCDIRLLVPESFENEVSLVLKDLSLKIPLRILS